VSMKQPFAPSGGATVNIDVASTTDSVALTLAPHQRVMNNGSATAWIAFGTDTVEAAAASGIPIAPGATEVLTPPVGSTYVAAIAAASTGRIYFTPGTGV
jgi:hypothetical protein